MKNRRALCLLLVCLLFANCALVSVSAKSINEATSTETVLPRASKTFSVTVAAGKIVVGNEVLSLEKGDSVSITAYFSPKYANADIGLIDESGSFTYVNVTNGSYDGDIAVEKRGNYVLGICNNSSFPISASGSLVY